MRRKKRAPRRWASGGAGENGAQVSAPSRLDSITSRERAQVFRSDGKMVGGIIGTTLRKHVDASRHFLRRPPAICFDRDVLLEAQSQGVQIVEVIDRESGNVFRASLALIWLKGFRLNRGYGDQVALALSLFNREDDAAPEAAPAMQPALFDLARS